MPYLSKLQVGDATRDVIESFGGYRPTLRTAENEFYDMKNMTGKYAPVLSVRDRRGVLDHRFLNGSGSIQGLAYKKDTLAYVRGDTLYYGDVEIPLKEGLGERELISMGAYLIVFPDMMYLNTVDTTDFGACQAPDMSCSGEANFLFVIAMVWKFLLCTFKTKML